MEGQGKEMYQGHLKKPEKKEFFFGSLEREDAETDAKKC
jgi:hypothetical protein